MILPTRTPFSRSWRRAAPHAVQRRFYSDPRPHRSAHAQWYADIVPAMIPVALLGSAVYLGLQLVQVHLSNERYLDGANAKIHELEKEVDVLRSELDRQIEASQNPVPPVDRQSRWWFAHA